MYHFVIFKLKDPTMQLDNGMLIISIDIDVGNKKLGLINKGKNDANVHRWHSEYFIGEIEERAIKLFAEMFNTLEIPATFAIRGQLTEIDESVFKLLINSPVNHDIGAHGYSHRNFQNLSQEEAESELKMISTGMEKFGVVPRSFIFPGNNVSHLRLLEKFGYKCFRDNGGFNSDAMCIEKKGLLYNIRPSLYLNQSLSPAILKKILNVAIEKRAPLHIWFHPWNFGNTNELIKKSINNMLLPLLTYAKSKEKRGLLTFETMLSAARKADKILGPIT
jgi:peptidoglycan/xylan/chitin deacetylase (PgdA/CDA1 family)